MRPGLAGAGRFCFWGLRMARRPGSLSATVAPRKWSTTSRKSRHERGYGREWDQTRKRILSRDRHLCQPCLATGRVIPGTEVDHVKPKSQGGTDDDANLQAICHPCHQAKTAREGHARTGA